MADIYAKPGAQFDATLSNAPSGQLDVGARILEAPGGAQVYARTLATEVLAGSGTYSVTLVAPSTQGDYIVLWDYGTVSPDTTASDVLHVTYSTPESVTPVDGNLITLDRLLDALNKLPSDMEDQEIEKYEAAIAAASAAVRAYAGRDFTLNESGTATARTFEYDDSGYIDTDDYMSVSSVSVTFSNGVFPVTLATNQWQEYPYNAEVKDNIVLYMPFYPGSKEMGFTYNLDTYEDYAYGPPPLVEITAVWGWPAIPEDVQQATVWAAAAFAEDARQVTSESIEGFSRSMNVLAPTALPLRARDLLDQYRKVSV